MTTEQIAPATPEELAAEIRRMKEEHAAFKQNVRDVSMKYARQHNLCRVVEQALEEAGLNSAKVRLTMTTMVPRTVVLDVPEDLIAGMDDDTILAKVTDYFAGRGNTDTRRAWQSANQISDNYGTPTEVQVERSELPHRGSSGLAPDMPGYVAKFFGYDGRKAHYIYEDSFNEARRTGRSATSMCGRQVGTVHQWHDRPQSRRSDGVCMHCAQILGV